jgi:hypothetical protein
MKAAIGLVGAGAVMLYTGVSGLSSDVLALAGAAGVACWVVSGWITD